VTKSTNPLKNFYLEKKGVEFMTERTISLTEQESQRVDAILLDRDKEEALKFLKEVIKEKLKTTQSRACGPKAV
jgi:hypothetical protein